MTELLVRNGADCKIRDHKMLPVYSEMLLQVCRDYQSVPDIRTIKFSEISFFYDGLRPELKSATKQKG